MIMGENVKDKEILALSETKSSVGVGVCVQWFISPFVCSCT